MSIQAVIFDWAGTTVDYGCFAPVEAFREVFRGVLIEPTMEETRAPMGMLKRDHIGAMLSMPRIAGEWQSRFGRPHTEADADALYGKFEEKLLKILPGYCEPKPGVTELVSKLREMGIKIGSTTGYTDQMMEIVTKGGLERGYAPDCWYSPDSTRGLGRPYPYMIYRNMETLRVSSVLNIVKVGDTVSDILEGKNAGVRSIGVVDGSSEMGLTQAEFDALTPQGREAARERVREVYRKAGADFIMNDLTELIPLLEMLP